jgi:BirA family biotin operon repressor/biotin-[acetyl-CoA-carboxylase] ligase
MIPSPENPLHPARIRAGLNRRLGLRLATGFEIRVVSETGSTNDDLLRLGESGSPEGLVLLAESQTSGRGRRGTAWESPPGVNLLFSILLRPEAELARWARLPHLAGVAICRAIEETLPGLPEVRLKWPNDLHLQGRKLAGILIESRRGPDGKPFAVLGSGLNVNAVALPESIRATATSLAEHAGRLLDRNELTAAILAEWAAVYPGGLADFEPVRLEMECRSALLNREIELLSEKQKHRGRVAGFGPDGDLVLEKEERVQIVIRSADLVRLV